MECNEEFSLGVTELIRIEDSNDIIVFGRLKGKVAKGDVVFFKNIGDDYGIEGTAKVVRIEDGPNSVVEEAKDCVAALQLENSAIYKIKQGTVVYSKNQTYKEKQSSYINALGDYYISKKKLELSDEEIENLTITDATELWRLFNWFCSKNAEKFSDNEKEDNKKKIEKILKSLCEKILDADEIYYLHNKYTDEPHLFSRTLKNEKGGYLCSSPDILICSRAYCEMLKEHYPEDNLEIRKILNGEEKKEIYNFFENSFYINGACGARMIFDNTAIDASMLVKTSKKTDKNSDDSNIANPDLVRWMLLLNQNEILEGEVKELNRKLYYNFMSRELTKAKFLVPMKSEGENSANGKNKVVTLDSTKKLIIPLLKGKDDQKLIPVYTDWNRFRKKHGDDWNAFVQTMEQITDKSGCVINVTNSRNATGVVLKEMFEKIKDNTNGK